MQTMSHSGSDQEASSSRLSRKSSATDPDKRSSGKVTSSKSRKRSSLEPVEYPRRRATIACEVCRSRKSRCDGARPKCRLCTELSAECVYREPGVKLDAGDKLILERLSRIESLLQSNSIADRRSFTSSPADLPSPGEDTNRPSRTPNIQNERVSWGAMSPTTFTMPSKHTTSALDLLRWPKIRDITPRRWDSQTLVQIEIQRESLSAGRARSLDFTNVELFIQSFFKVANIWYACINPYQWHMHYRIAHSRNFLECPESCLVLLVMALGAASYQGSISRFIEGVEPVGMPFFMCAWSMLPSLITRTDMISCQCLFLTCAYLTYLVRPLEAWNLLSSLSKKLQLLVSGPISNFEQRISERIFWNMILLESDLQTEMDLPPSTTAKPEDLPSLPRHFESDGEPSVAPDDLDYFLARIDLRILCNRVCSALYTSTVALTDTMAIRPIIEDLDTQLTRWYEDLPLKIRFDLHTGRAPHASASQIVLRLRFFACRTMIYRPYVLAVLNDEAAMQSRTIKDGCRQCLEACIRQLENVTAHHAGHLAYLWQGALSIVSQTLLIMGSTFSTSLSELLPPPHQMNAIIDDVVREIDRYSQLAPSLKLAAEIVREADKRRRAALISPITTSRITLH